jgi:Outer membrane efflux protein
VSRALTALEKLVQIEAEQARAVQAYEDAVRIAKRRYVGGLASYFEVLEAQQLLFPAETQLAQVRADRLFTYVQLYRVLGGGWHLTDAQWSGPQAKSQGPAVWGYGTHADRGFPADDEAGAENLSMRVWDHDFAWWLCC